MLQYTYAQIICDSSCQRMMKFVSFHKVIEKKITSFQLKPLKVAIFRCNNQRRRKQFESGGGHMASAELEPIRGLWDWSGGLKDFLGIIRRKDRQYLPLYQLLIVLKYLPNIAWNRSRPTVHKKIHTHNACANVNRLNCRTRSASDVQNHTARSHYLAIIRE